MSEKTKRSDGIGSGLHSIFFGTNDPRLRATWRFLLACPLLPLVGALVALVMPLIGVAGMIPGGPLQGIVLLAILVPWARYVDRQPLSDYGVSATPSWVLNLLVGFLGTAAVWSIWHATASALGWMQIEVSLTAPQESLAFGLIGTLVSLAINTWVQDVVFFAIILTVAAEGLRGRGVDARWAVVGGWVVGALFFTAIHGTPTVSDFASTLVGGAVYGLLYVHTGSLALTIGAHWGGGYVVTSVFTSEPMVGTFPSVFQVTKSLPGGIEGFVGIALYVATYVVLAGWIKMYHGTVSTDGEISR